MSLLSTFFWMACDLKFSMEGDSLPSEDESDVKNVGLNFLALPLCPPSQVSMASASTAQESAPVSAVRPDFLDL